MRQIHLPAPRNGYEKRLTEALHQYLRELYSLSSGGFIASGGAVYSQGKQINFAGAGVVVSESGGVITATIAGGGGGGSLDDVLAVQALL